MGKKRAKEHYDFIKEQYYKEIDNSIANTTIHACESIAEEHGVQTLILGAWGCGVFEWNPEIVAELFMEILYSPFLGYLNITTWFLIGCFRNSKTKMVFEILMAWENEFVKIFTLFPEIHAPVLSHFITLKHYS